MHRMALKHIHSRKIRVLKPAEREHQKASPTYASGPMQAQQPMGNQAMQRMLLANAVQAKLTVNPPDDEYEKEADQVADTVIRMPVPAMPPSEPEKDDEEKRLQTKLLPDQNLHLIQRDETEKEEDEEKMLLQTKPLSSQDALIQREEGPEDEEKKKEEEMPIQAKFLSMSGASLLQRETDTGAEEEEKKKEEEETPIQTKLLPEEEPSILEEAEDERRKARYKDEEEGLIQRKTASGKPRQAVDERLLHNLGSGQPLDHGTRDFFEPRFGQDFSGVRVHSDAQSGQASKMLNAQAFTTGQDIYFGEGSYQSATLDGKRLLAHELAHTVQQASSVKTSLIQREPAPPAGGGGGAAPLARVVYIDANIIIQINRGNQDVANALRQMRSSGVDVRISPFQYNELVRNPDIPRTATAQRLMLEEMSIRQGASPTMAQRVDVNLAGQTAAGGNIMQIRDQQLVSSARADGRSVEIWSLDTPFRSNPRQVENTYGVRIAPESQLPVTGGRPDYRVGRQLLGLEPVQITLTGEVIRGVPPSGGGGTAAGGRGTPVPPSPGASAPGTSTSTGTKVVAGGVGIIVVLNEILGGIGRVRRIQQHNIDMGNARIAFWERFGAKPTRGVWDQNGRRPLPPGTTPSTDYFGSPSFPYVVDIDVNAFRSSLPDKIDSYQDFLYFLDAAKTLGVIEEDPLMPDYPNREQRAQPRRYSAWVNQPDRDGRRSYDITGIISQVRTAALGELEEGMREQTRALSPEQQANIYRLRNGPETQIFRSAGGGQPIKTAQQLFGPDPWVRTIGREKDIGGWFSTDIRKLVVPANADAQRAALVSAYWVKQPIEDTFDEVREGGRPILDRQPAEGPISSFVAGPEPGSYSRFGQTRYYRHHDPNMRWTIALGELHEFWVRANDLERVSSAEVAGYTRPR